MNKTVEVRIRPDWEADSKHLTYWPIDELDALVRTVGMWGFYEGEKTISTTDITGEFRWEPIPHFEIVGNTES